MINKMIPSELLLAIAMILVLASSTRLSHASDAPRNIFETLGAAPECKILVAAVKAAGLSDTLKGKGPLTVLAPTDEAFAKLPPGTVEELLKSENLDKLRTILSFHVVPGRIGMGLQQAESAEGSYLTFMATGTAVVNGAEILLADIPASNGTIHLIDTVLMPGAREASESQAAEKLILAAIHRGVPLFNAGEIEACARVYAKTVQQVAGLFPNLMLDGERGRLQAALLASRSHPNPRERAWILRRAMDAALLELRMPHEEMAPAEGSTFLIDDFTRENSISSLGTQWRLFTDRVMGGVSNATASYEDLDGRRCLRLKGDVSLENNGGFVQVALSLKADGGTFDAGSYKGLRLWTRGNGEDYYIHLRNNRTRLPWQYYSASFTAGSSWNKVDIPFDRFTQQNLGAELDPSALLRIGIVGAKKVFNADVAVARIELYR